MEPLGLKGNHLQDIFVSGSKFSTTKTGVSSLFFCELGWSLWKQVQDNPGQIISLFLYLFIYYMCLSPPIHVCTSWVFFSVKVWTPCPFILVDIFLVSINTETTRHHRHGQDWKAYVASFGGWIFGGGEGPGPTWESVQGKSTWSLQFWDH